jgi:hypothetical protein
MFMVANKTALGSSGVSYFRLAFMLDTAYPFNQMPTNFDIPDHFSIMPTAFTSQCLIAIYGLRMPPKDPSDAYIQPSTNPIYRISHRPDD